MPLFVCSAAFMPQSCLNYTACILVAVYLLHHGASVYCAFQAGFCRLCWTPHYCTQTSPWASIRQAVGCVKCKAVKASRTSPLLTFFFYCRKQISYTIPEEQRPGTIVVHITAKDPDDEGFISRLTYSISPPNEYFSINPCKTKYTKHFFNLAMHFGAKKSSNSGLGRSFCSHFKFYLSFCGHLVEEKCLGFF